MCNIFSCLLNSFYFLSFEILKCSVGYNSLWIIVIALENNYPIFYCDISSTLILQILH